MKKMVSLALVCILLATLSLSASAGGLLIGENPSLEEQMAALTPQQQAQLLEKRAYLTALRWSRADWNPANIAAYDMSGFPYKPQETEYWCLAACGQMILQYCEGITQSQSTIATGMKIKVTSNGSGGYLPDAMDYLNRYVSDPYYCEDRTLVNQYGFDMFEQSIHYVVTRSGQPAVWGGTFPNGGNGWPYRSTVNHSVVVTGWKRGMTDYHVYDPYVKPYINPGHDGNFYVKKAGLRDGLSNWLS